MLQTIDNDYYLFKSDILAGLVTYSTGKGVAANLETITAERARAIIEMNKRGEKPESLTEDGKIKENARPADLLADADISRFDKAKKKKKKQPKKQQPRDNAAQNTQTNPNAAQNGQTKDNAAPKPQRRDNQRRDNRQQRQPNAGPKPQQQQNAGPKPQQQQNASPKPQPAQNAAPKPQDGTQNKSQQNAEPKQ